MNHAWTQFNDYLTQLVALSQNPWDGMSVLYHHQCAHGVVPHAALSAIQNATQIPSPTHWVWLQYNPLRMTRGISPIVNPTPIHIIPYKDGVPCFCCTENIAIQWPNERGWIRQSPKGPLVILPNPSPLFSYHMTIVSQTHIPQTPAIATCISWAQVFPNTWIIQNGSGAGATNPWHFHLQSFKATLPIASAPFINIATKTGKEIAKWESPFPVYRIRYSLPIDDKESLVLDSSLQSYLKANPCHTFNLLTMTHDATIDIYIAPRHSECTTPLYTTGQPGYAEIGGVIAVGSKNSWQEWSTHGASRLYQILTDISPPQTSILQFESAII